MKISYKKLLILILPFFLLSCENEDDTLSPNEINNFVYRILSEVYLYKDQSPDLTNNRFSNTSEKNNFIARGGSPEAFFERLTIPQDRFSFIVDDFEFLENFFKGVFEDDGLDYRLDLTDDESAVFLTMQDVFKGSPGEKAGFKRGMIFNRIDGEKLTRNNTSKLNSKTIRLGAAKFEGENLVSLPEEISVTKIEFTEDPISIAKVIEIEGKKIGYLMYNSFIFEKEEQLNNEFATFKSAGVTDFVLDLRYNGGGAVHTANALSGIITGQFANQVYSRRKWNSDIQALIEKDDPSILIDNFVTTTAEKGTSLNSLNLNKVYVITTKRRTASASELVINSLKPYIDVVVIGDPEGTVGKSQASRTYYDSPSGSKKDVNPAHKYALQPLIFSTVNKDGIGISNQGIAPDIAIVEDPRNLGVLGDPNEPLLKKAIDNILGRDVPSAKFFLPSNYIGGSINFKKFKNEMYIHP